MSWTRATGIVSSYSVLLFRDLKLINASGGLSKETSTEILLDLTPGVLYCVVVVTHAHSLNTSSSEVCNATRESQVEPGS